MADDNGIEFEDSENFKKGEDKLTIKHIILKQVQKCMMEGSKEMTQGGTKKRIVNDKVVEEAVPNQREVFINSVEMLRIVLLRRFKHYCEKKDDNDIKQLFESSQSELEELQKSYNAAKKKIITDRNKQDSLNQTNNKIGMLYNNFELKKVEIYKQFLISISYLLDEEHYFEEESATGGV